MMSYDALMHFSCIARFHRERAVHSSLCALRMLCVYIWAVGYGVLNGLAGVLYRGACTTRRVNN